MADPPERTPDGRYIVVGGRRWRASDPDIPEDRRQELVARLMAYRRDVAAAGRSGDDDAVRAARAGVHETKVALGERGPAWWTQSDEERRARWSGAASDR